MRQPTIRPLKTRFPCGSASYMLNLAGYRNSPVRSTKSTPSDGFHPPTACKRTVSGSLSLPSRGAFHLSLTVLFAIGRQGVFSLGKWSSLIPTRFHVSRGTHGPTSFPQAFRLRDFHSLRRRFPAPSAGPSSASGCRSSPCKPYNPGKATPAGFDTLPVWAPPRSLAAT
jgi:hypothetical protein